MLSYIIRRILMMFPLLLVISIVSFAIIELPAGDYATTQISQLEEFGTQVGKEQAEAIRRRFGLDQVLYTRYAIWIWAFVQGDFGDSMAINSPVRSIIGERMLLSFTLVFLTIFISWTFAIIIGIYSAVHKYTISDYFFTFFGLIGIAVPTFLAGLIYIFFAVFYFNADSTVALFSEEYIDALWSFGKVIDLLKHIGPPIIILGFGGMAGTMRIMRGNLIDVLNHQYIQTARAKGLKERVVVLKHAARVAINPLISRLGQTLPATMEQVLVLSIVFNLYTIGPIFLEALFNQDTPVAVAIIMLQAVFLIVGNLIADLVLAWADPRIRLD